MLSIKTNIKESNHSVIHLPAKHLYRNLEVMTSQRLSSGWIPNCRKVAVRIETFLLFQFGDSWVTSCFILLVTRQTSWVALVWITTSICVTSDWQICIWICKICGSEAFWEPNRLTDCEFFHLQIAERTQNNLLVCRRFITPYCSFHHQKWKGQA